jgi:selenide,water dikinase
MLAAVLQPVQNAFPAKDFPDVMVGLQHPDDAAVYRLNDEQAIVTTVDFFTPVVDDAYAYGAIAAANALSDVYAMGGDVLFALNIAALPEDLPAEIIADIMRGGADKVKEAGAAIIGGHTVKDDEPKYGLCVTGIIHPSRVMTKGGAKPGDALVLTKALGAGVITTALKNDQATNQHVDTAIESMSRLNRTASKLARQFEARGGTDITGYGLLGHAVEMATQADAQFVFHWDKLPFLPGALDYGQAWIFPGGANTNKAAYEPCVRFDDALAEWQRMMIFDPETSGGLLVPISRDRADEFVEALREHGEQACIVGQARDGKGIVVTR